MFKITISQFTKSYFLMLIVVGVVGVGSFSACKKKDDSVSKGTYKLMLPADSSIIAYVDKNHTKPVTDLATIEANTIVYLKAVADNVTINNLDIDNNSLTNGANIATVTMNANKKVTSTINTDGFIFNGNTLNSYKGSLTKIYIPNVYKGTTITTIAMGDNGDSVFNSSITNIIIPNSITTIGNSAFSGYTGFTSIVIPNSVTNMGELVFYNCSELTSIIIGNGVTSIGYETFQNCTKLNSVIIGNSVTTIGMNAFTFCNSLTSLTIPSSVTSIGSAAFAGCPALNSVTMQGTTPPTLEYSIFDNTTSIYVPKTSLNAYKTASGWSDYVSQIYSY